jgi:hypothetical protein
MKVIEPGHVYELVTLDGDGKPEVGKVRELLCNHCNRGLGAFFDSPDLLMKAAAYVKLHTETLVESVAE